MFDTELDVGIWLDSMLCGGSGWLFGAVGIIWGY